MSTQLQIQKMTRYFILILLITITIYGVNGIVLHPPEWIQGGSASITCTDQTVVRIYKDDVILTNCVTFQPLPCNISSDTIYTLSRNNRSVTINIADVSRDRDGGVWRCEYFNTKENITIDVKVPVSTVTINNMNSLIFTAGQAIPITCQTGVSRPHARITWSIGGNNQGSGTITNNTGGTTTSILQYTADKTDHNNTLQCSATNGYGTTKRDSIILNIRYSPVVHIEPSTSPNKVVQWRPLNLTCVVDEANPPVPSTGYTWSKDDVIQPGESSLEYNVQSVERSETGSYMCTGNNSVGTGRSTTSVQVDVLFPPIVSTSSQYKVVELTDVSLQCSATANPGAITYRWTGPGNVTSTGATLSISSISKDGSGVYTCTATNLMIPTSTSSPETGRGENTTTVDILYEPIVTISPDLSNLKLQENTPLQLTCTVQSNPPPTSFKWYKPDGTSQDVSTDGRLVIPNIKRYQAGLYRCEANTTLVPTNGDSISRSDSKTTNITVLYLDPVTISSSGLEVSEDEGVNITCSTNSNPVASITWYNGSIFIKTDINTDTFIIDRATCLDTAVYSCHVTNTEFQDRQFNQSASVFVRCSPRPATRFDSQSIITGSITDTVQLVADIIAYPAPSFTWYYTNTTTGGLIPISNDGFYQQIDVNTSINTFNSTLNINISSSIFYRSYTVNVTNDGGSYNLMFTVQAQAAPDPPSNITYSTLGTDRICIDWRAGFNGGDQQQFIIQHSTDGKSWTDSTTISISNYCIENLQPDTLYYIRVVARNKYGDSQPVYLLSEQGDIRTTKEPKTLPLGLIGGIAGGCVALILIIIIAVIIFKKRRNAAKETERIELTTEKAGETPTREDDMVVDINLDYVSADQLLGASGAAADADGGTVNSSSVDHSQKEPVYAEVDKSKNSKMNTKLTKDKTPTNQVDTSKKDQSKKANAKPAKMPKPQTKPETKNKTPTREVYENVGIFGDFKGDPDELTTNKTNNTPQKAVKKGEDLVYADLDFVAHKPSSGVLRKDEEGGVEYAGIDYTKRGPTPPPPSDSDDD